MLKFRWGQEFKETRANKKFNSKKVSHLLKFDEVENEC